MNRYFSTVNGTDTSVLSHAIVRTPPPCAPFSIAIVSCSTGRSSAALLEIDAGDVLRSSYSRVPLPGLPVDDQFPGAGGRERPERVVARARVTAPIWIARVVVSVVASSAPVAQTRP